MVRSSYCLGCHIFTHTNVHVYVNFLMNLDSWMAENLSKQSLRYKVAIRTVSCIIRGAIIY